MKNFTLICYSLVILLMACKKEAIQANEDCTTGTSSGGEVIIAHQNLNLPASPFDYGYLDAPNHFVLALENLDNSPSDNLTTNHGATLGRVLFYEKNLSINNTVSCASCHHQDKAFTDGMNFSVGFNGELTRRNSMSLINVSLYHREKMFWDERAQTLEEQVLMPIEDPVEMGLNLNEVVPKLENLEYYPGLFYNAFGDSTITLDKISKALAQFIRSIYSYNSKFDRVLMGLESFNSSEQNGSSIFNSVGSQQGCVGCHAGGIGNTDAYNFQISTIPSRQGPHDLNDLGVFEITEEVGDSSKFKVSSFRNIELTAPYLHNGSVSTLEDLFSPGNGHNFGMTSAEINHLIAFLKTLTDSDVTTDVRFSDPFVE